MPPPVPQPLQSLVSATDPGTRERAWADLLAAYSPLILHVARAMGGDHDAVMDRYTFVLEALRRDDYRRLGAYASDGRGSFQTWLAVVVRRICLDEYRQRYGRLQGDGAASAEQHAQRRSLVNLVGTEFGLDAVEASRDEAPDALLGLEERRAALERALGCLEPADRLLLRLRFEDELSVPEIARLLDLGSPFKLYRRLDKLLAALRESLKAIGVDDATP
jgi:RNA polymerase sigma factor (sigma-70 family)